ncbi:HAD family hydrolase [Roseburia hominis]
MIKHILFDLDGTLLPMVQDEYVEFYLPLLAKHYISHGVKVDPKAFIGAVWKGYAAMVGNDGSRTNQDAFWNFMDEVIPMSREEAEEISLEFYEGEFNKTIAVTKPTPLANEVVKTAKAKGIQVYLATNPVFPRCCTMNRIRWAGLDAEDFRIITTYEDNRFCKPNPAYFSSIMEQFGLKPEECLMVGNDVEEDLAIRQLGVKTYLLTDTLENKKNLPIETEYSGSMRELLEFVKKL